MYNTLCKAYSENINILKPFKTRFKISKMSYEIIRKIIFFRCLMSRLWDIVLRCFSDILFGINFRYFMAKEELIMWKRVDKKKKKESCLINWYINILVLININLYLHNFINKLYIFINIFIRKIFYRENIYASKRFQDIIMSFGYKMSSLK